MPIKLIKGCIGSGTCVKTCPTDVIRQDAKTKKAITARCLMLALGVTSLVRKKLPMQNKTWRVFHGILAMLF